MAPLLAILISLRTPEGRIAAGPPSPADVRQEFLARINEARVAAGAPPLRLAEALNQVAQANAEEVRENGGVVAYDEKAIPRIQRRLRTSGYEAHGWHQAFAAAPGGPGDVLAWIQAENAETFRELLNPTWQEAGIGLSDLRGAPLYTFFLAWRESESFALQTAGLADLARVRGEMLARVNAERREAGLSLLLPDPRLDAAAQRHAEDMLARSYYSHSSPEGNSPGSRVRESGYAPRLVAENIARGPFTVQEAMDNWMASRDHRGNLLHPGFLHLGVGVAVGRNSAGYTVLWVQSFGAPAP